MTERPLGAAAAPPRVARWRRVFDLLYQSPAARFTGWVSRLDGQLIPERDMEAWLAETASKILARAPGAVLEIGCGSGVLARAIAGRIQSYAGLDLSPAAIEAFRAEADWPPATARALMVCAAHDLPVSLGLFDAVVLNSVIQYFPDEAYLDAVLEAAGRRLAPGGALFIGDVRHAGLLDELLTSAAWLTEPRETPVRDLRERIAAARQREAELLVSPERFHRTVCGAPLAHAEVELKRAHYRNELSDFRFDVTVTRDRTPSAPTEAPVDWGDLGDIAVFAQWLSGAKTPVLALLDVPNGRLDIHRARIAALSGAPEDARLGELIVRPTVRNGVDPADLVAVAASVGYGARPVWSPGQAPDVFDVVMTRDPRDSIRWSARAAIEPAPVLAQSGAANG